MIGHYKLIHRHVIKIVIVCPSCVCMTRSVSQLAQWPVPTGRLIYQSYILVDCISTMFLHIKDDVILRTLIVSNVERS